MSDREEYDSDAPEEFTAEQGIKQEQELSKLQIENKARAAREGKERRRKWAQKKTPRKATTQVENVQNASENGTEKESMAVAGLLSSELVEVLVAREKQVFLDSDDEKANSKPTKKKKRKSSGVETIILNRTAPPPCLEKSLEFLRQRKMKVPRSQAVLNNSNQALRFLTSSVIVLAPDGHLEMIGIQMEWIMSIS